MVRNGDAIHNVARAWKIGAWHRALIIVLYAVRLAGDPMLFFWWTLGPLTLVTAAGLIWHRRIEARLAAEA